MKLSKSSLELLIGILIAVFFGVSLIFRIALPYDEVFVGNWIKFTSNDAYYHMRLVDNLVHNFPHLTQFDPFLIYPRGMSVGGLHFFDWLLSVIIWVIGLGSPTQHTIDVVGAYFPAILAALTVIPLYFLGKALFHRWAGLLAAALVALLPGEFLGRSILAFTDHHVAETLFSTIAILFLVLAIKTAGERQLAYSHIMRRDRAVIIRPLIYGLLAGVFLGIYLITWLGGLLFIFIISLYLLIQFIIDHLRHNSTDYLGILGTVTFLVALIIYLPYSLGADYTAAMVIALVIPMALSGTSLLMSARQLKPAYYPPVLIGIGIIFMLIFYAVAPDTLGAMLKKFSIFAPAGATATTTLEMQPFLSPHGSFSTAIAWGNFTTSFFLTPWWPIPGFALISFVILLYLSIKRRGDEKHWQLFLVWTLVALVVTLGQRRFAYYLVVNIALLSAYISWQIIWLGGLRKLVTSQEETTEMISAETAKSQKKGDSKRPDITIYYVNTALAIIVVFIGVFLFNIIKSKEVAEQARFAPSDAWQSSLSWMKENTPDPLGTPDAYNKLYARGYKYPESAYGVTSWWDYGYWITRTAERLPSTNPSQAPAPITKVAKLFLSRDESQIRQIMAELDSSYIIADYSMSTSKFWAIVTWAGEKQTKFNDVYLVPYEGNKLIQKVFYYPEYYQSILVRLYNFDGKAVAAESPTVIAYNDITDPAGNHYKIITDTKEFSSYQEALDYAASQKSGNYRVVGVNPFRCPIPLEAVPNYQMVHSSESLTPHKDLRLLPKPEINVINVPEVKIFEYIK